jgi:hypothetical protein
MSSSIRPRLGSAPLSISAKDYELLCEYYESDMVWVNDVFFPESRPVAVATPDVHISEDDPIELTLSERERFLVGCLVDLTKQQARPPRSQR